MQEWEEEEEQELHQSRTKRQSMGMSVRERVDEGVLKGEGKEDTVVRKFETTNIKLCEAPRALS